MKSSQSESSQSTTEHLRLGKLGEAYAAAHLDQMGYRLVAANFTIAVGRNLRGAVVNSEIDLIAYDGPTLCFIEVKTRASDWFAPPQVNVDRHKQRQIARAAKAYRRMLQIEHEPYRYDVVTVILDKEVSGTTTPTVELLRNYWRDEQFRKRYRHEWFYD
ncbi:MAG TPA: YraN family protein [Pyrinomonadaceae bacterium]|nr:YraN family protein [Pyrinomonadaceae bacterium]